MSFLIVARHPSINPLITRICLLSDPRQINLQWYYDKVGDLFVVLPISEFNDYASVVVVDTTS
jgi:hypothetical protein